MMPFVVRQSMDSPLSPYPTLFRSIDERALDVLGAGTGDAAGLHGLPQLRLDDLDEAADLVDHEGQELVARALRSEEHTSELQSPCNLVCRLLLEYKNKVQNHERSA